MLCCGIQNQGFSCNSLAPVSLTCVFQAPYNGAKTEPVSNDIIIFNGLSWEFVQMPSGLTVVNTLSSVANTMTSTVNGVLDTAPIINSNTLTLDGNGDIVSTVNGVASTPLDLPSDSLVSSNSGNVIATHTDVGGNIVDVEETVTTITNTVTGHLIGTYTNEAGAVVNINETVTTLGSLTLVGNILTVPYTDENGVVTNRTIDLTSLAIDVNVTSLTYNPVTGEIILTETDGTQHIVDIGPFVETTITVVDSNSIDLTSSGTSGHTIQADVKVDPASCGLSITANGLLSTAIVNVVDSNSVDLTKTGCDITADVKISGTAGNDIVVNADGLFVDVPSCEDIQDCVGTMFGNAGLAYNDGGNNFTTTGTSGQVYEADGAGSGSWVTPAAGHVPVTVVDSTTVDLTASGTDNQTITAAVNISSTAGNDLIVNADGLFVDVTANETPFVANDSDTVDFTVSGTNGHTLTAEVKIQCELTSDASGLKLADTFYDATSMTGVTGTITAPNITGPVEEVYFVRDACSLRGFVNKASGAGATTNVLDSAANVMTSTVNGVADTAPIINTNVVTYSAGNLTTTVNGVVSNSVAIPQTPLVANDSSTIDFTTSGTDDHTLTAVVKIDPASCNLSSTVNGLLSTTKNITNAVAGGGDLTTITQTVTGCDTLLKLSLSSDAGQILQTGTDGKLLAQISATTETIGATGSILIQNDADATIERLKDPLCVDATTVSTSVMGDRAGKWGIVHAQDWLTVRAVAADTTLIPATDSVIAVSAAGGSRTITLVAPVDCERRDFWIKRTDNVVANTVTLTGGGNIEGVASITLSTVGGFGGNYGESAHIVWTGTEWLVI
jgi:hypothetical protein